MKSLARWFGDKEKIEKLQTFDSTCLFGERHFEDDKAQILVGFQPIFKYVKILANSNAIKEWKIKGLLEESIIPPTWKHDKVTSTSKVEVVFSKLYVLEKL